MAINQDKRVIHRFIRNISDYELGGEFHAQIIPLDTQAYAIYPDKDGNKLFYVIGDGEHTYTEIRDGLGNGESHKEYPVFTESNLDNINNGIEEEAEARKQADEVLQSNIDKEASERERFDNLLDETLCEEILIRTSADETLGQNISNETAAREAGDEVLQGRISDEEARALQAETVLQTTKQDVLTAGTGISIENNVISSTQTSAEWGNIGGTLSDQADLQEALDKKQDVLDTVVAQKVVLADVALTGDYDDLTDKPTIPVVNNATLTITQGGTTKGTFTANADSDVTIDLDAGGSGDSASWGNITGTLSDQTDLNNVLNDKQDALTAGTNIEITNNVISTTSTMLHKVLNTVVQVASFVSDDTYEGYLYRVDIPVTGITANHVPYVMLSITDSISANYSTFVESGDGYVSMWSKALPESAITIPVITYE